MAIEVSTIGDPVYAKSNSLNAEVLNYHLKLAKGMLETCFTHDSETDNFVPNPALPMLSDLAKTCDKKMKSLDNFLAKFVGDENGRIYAEHFSNRTVE